MILHPNILESVMRSASSVYPQKTSRMVMYSHAGRITPGGIYLRMVIDIVSAGAVTLSIAKIIMTILNGM